MEIGFVSLLSSKAVTASGADVADDNATPAAAGSFSTLLTGSLVGSVNAGVASNAAKAKAADQSLEVVSVTVEDMPLPEVGGDLTEGVGDASINAATKDIPLDQMNIDSGVLKQVDFSSQTNMIAEQSVVTEGVNQPQKLLQTLLQPVTVQASVLNVKLSADAAAADQIAHTDELQPANAAPNEVQNMSLNAATLDNANSGTEAVRGLKALQSDTSESVSETTILQAPVLESTAITGSNANSIIDETVFETAQQPMYQSLELIARSAALSSGSTAKGDQIQPSESSNKLQQPKTLIDNDPSSLNLVKASAAEVAADLESGASPESIVSTAPVTISLAKLPNQLAKNVESSEEHADDEKKPASVTTEQNLLVADISNLINAIHTQKTPSGTGDTDVEEAAIMSDLKLNLKPLDVLSAAIRSPAKATSSQGTQGQDMLVSSDAKNSPNDLAAMVERILSQGAASKSSLSFEQMMQENSAASAQLSDVDGAASISAASSAQGLTHSQMDKQLGATKAKDDVAYRSGRPTVSEQVHVSVRKAISEGLDKLTVRLDPANLGKVEVRMEMNSNGTSHIVFTAEHKSTLDALQQDARYLQKSLEESGVKADAGTMEFNLKQNQTFNQNETGTESAREEILPPVRVAEDEVNDDAVTSHYMVRVTEGVDIKV